MNNLVELAEVHIRHQLGFHMIDCVIQSIDEFIEVFLIKEYLVFFISEPIFFKPFLTLSDSKLIVVGTSRFHIKEIGPFSGFYFR